MPDYGCFHTADNGSSYRGGASATASGATCAPWAFLENDVEFNYCRNPNQTQAAAPWCYTDTDRTTWELCDVNRCTACYSGAGGDYIGGAKFSITNKECLPWTDPGQTLYAIADFEQT